MEQNETTALENVIRRLKKLQKLYEGAKAINSEGEASAAAAKIQELLTEYNLTLEQVDESIADDKKRTEVGHEYSSGYTYKSIGGYWEMRLTYIICKYNYCRCYTVGAGYKKLMLVGEPHNLEVVKWLRETLSEVYVKLSNKRWKEFTESIEYRFMSPKMSKDRFQRNYLMGCTKGLEAKLYEEREAEKRKAQEGITALVLKKDAALDVYVSAKFKIGTSQRTDKTSCSSATSMGYTDGKNTNLNKVIHNGKKPAKALA